MSSSIGRGQGDDAVYGVGPYGGLRDLFSLQRVIAGLGALAVLATVPFGGMKKAVDVHPDRGLERLAVNQVYDAGPYKITITGARLLKDQPPLYATNKANRWVIILATVEVTADESRNDAATAIHLRGVAGVPDMDGMLRNDADSVLVRSDLTVFYAAHPGMPEELVIGWEQDSKAAVPTEVDVLVTGRTYRMNTFNESMEWLDEEDRAIVTVPVLDRRNT
ncbi:hypothetical protein [Luedemannella flava]|uniref:hypothetical protein n=1 Tax=Luedemannella flava TaxID=349316 RepID=UPI0031D348F1